MSEQGLQPTPLDQRGTVAQSGLVALLSSMRFALGLVGAITVACVVATLLPQGAEVTEHLQRNPDTARWLKRLAAAGLTNVFSSWWFIGLLVALGASLVACIGCRIKILAQGAALAKPERKRMTGSLLIHTGLLLTLLGGAIRIFFADHGMLQLREGEDATFFVTEDNQRVPLPFTLHLVKFEIERYSAAHSAEADDVAIQSEKLHIQDSGTGEGFEIPAIVGAQQRVVFKSAVLGALTTNQVQIVRRISDFAMDTTTREVHSRSDKPLNPAFLVRVSGTGEPTERWLFARYPDFEMGVKSGQTNEPLPFKLIYNIMVRAPEKPGIKSFKSTVQLRKGDEVIQEKIVEVNAPLTCDGYSFFQSGYNEENLSWTALRVVHDPSVPVVYLGFILLCLGALITAGYRAETPQPVATIQEESHAEPRV